MKTNNRKILSENLNLLMKHHEDTQASLGKKIGASQKTVGNYLRSDYPITPTLEKIEDIANAYKTEVWKLFVENADINFLTTKDSFVTVVNADQGKLQPKVKMAIEFLTNPPKGMKKISDDFIHLINSIADFKNVRALGSLSIHDNQVNNQK